MKPVQFAKTAEELRAIVDLRYQILRQPWGQPIETASDELEGTSVNAYLADDNGRVIACGRLQENAGRTGQIRYMAVAADQQGKGLGKQIVSFLEAKAIEKGLQRIELQARENAVAFYKAAGYTLKEKSFLLWGRIQHYLMEKVL